MKKINTNLLVSLALLFATTLSLIAQQNESQRAKFNAERVEFFNEKLELSEVQTEKFWPVYHDFQNRMNKINEDERSLLTYYSSNSDAMTEDEIDETIAKYLSLQNSRQSLSEEYHQSFVNILGKRKTMELYTLERRFRMHILDTLRKGRHGQGQGKGFGRGGYR